MWIRSRNRPSQCLLRADRLVWALRAYFFVNWFAVLLGICMTDNGVRLKRVRRSFKPVFGTCFVNKPRRLSLPADDLIRQKNQAVL